MRLTIAAACLGLVLLCLAPFAGTPPDGPTAALTSRELPTIAVSELAPKLQARLPSSDSGNSDDVTLSDNPRSAELDAIDQPDPATSEPPRPQVSVAEFCAALTAAAEASNIPVAFFARLIWQESRFKFDQTSPAGAQGVAQFMPRTANEVGLDDPFDPLKALPASARFLRRLHNQFGNLGLAAAAYNAGSGRIQNWLARREALPAETQAYVRTITGNSAENWVSESKIVKLDQQLPAQAPCEGAGGLSRDHDNVAVAVSLTPAISSVVRKAEQEAVAAAKAAAKAAAEAAAAAREKVRIAALKLKRRKTVATKSSGSSKIANADKRGTRMASASAR